MSYADLDSHPKKFDLMRTAFTLHIGIQDGLEMWKETQKSTGDGV